ncbi:MAG: sigma 54-interacting transcriptional regulator [Planctomycetaceae bacterium]
MLDRAVVLLGDRGQRRRFCDLLKHQDMLADVAKSADELRTRISRDSCDLLVIGREMLDDEPQDVLASLRTLPDAPDVVVVSDREDPAERAEMLSQGCLAVLYQDLPTSTLKSVLQAVIARRRERQPATVDRIRTMGRPRLADFVSESETMRTFMSVVERVAPSNTTLLILGETGVGKERLAQAIHNESLRNAGPFVAVNCAALTESLLESELFGHEEGAFTGATRSRRGCFEVAHRGTLFLDEIGEMPQYLQAKLLRVLQEREVQRVGGERPVPVDVRLMAASNRDIQSQAAAGEFRRDLYYRLSVVTLRIPPLRDRREDIPMLVDSYINYFRTQMAHQATRVSPEALQALVEYDWAGNVRELINVMERALLLCPHETIGMADLPAEFSTRARTVKHSDPIQELLGSEWGRQPLGELLEAVEQAYLVRLLRETCGRVGRTATLAGIDPRVLYEKMRRHGLEKHAFRDSP